MSRSTAVVLELEGVLLTTQVVPLLAGDSEFFEEMQVLSDAVDQGRLGIERTLELFTLLLRELPVAEAQRRVAAVSLDREVLRCIHELGDRCTVVTALPGDWLLPVNDQLSGRLVASKAAIVEGRAVGIDELVDKAGVVKRLEEDQGPVVAVGAGASDIAMLEAASIRVAHGEDPPLSLHEIADFVTPSGRSLCNLLTSL